MLQFFLIVVGFLPLVWLGTEGIGRSGRGWSERCRDGVHAHPGRHMGDAQHNPMDIEWFGLAMGLGFVLSFGYWCTDFLVVQRAMAAESMAAARRTPLIAAIPKMLFPFLVIVPGIIAVALPSTEPLPIPPSEPAIAGATQRPRKGIIPQKVDEKTGQLKVDKDGKPEFDYDLAIPNMLIAYFRPACWVWA